MRHSGFGRGFWNPDLQDSKEAVLPELTLVRAFTRPCIVNLGQGFTTSKEKTQLSFNK